MLLFQCGLHYKSFDTALTKAHGFWWKQVTHEAIAQRGFGMTQLPLPGLVEKSWWKVGLDVKSTSFHSDLQMTS